MEATSPVHQLIAPLVAEAGASLYDLEHTGGVLRVTVDREGGVDIGLIGAITRAISRALDETDPIAGQYTLEVSSPGLERPLRRPDHFQSAIGSLVSVKVRPGVEGDRRLKGVLVAADDDTATIEPSGAEPGSTRVIALGDIERARTVFEWGPAPKPGSGTKPGSTPSSKKKAARS